jgi:CBS domain-containing membrane protein
MTQPEAKPSRFRFFEPILPGATIRERIIACIGASIGIGLTVIICRHILGDGVHLPLIVAPIGASAIILFVLPASPMAQPWPIIGGNTISALAGVLTARYIGDQMLALAVAISLAMIAMSLTRSLHPPGGAAALTAILGGPAVTASGFAFPFLPVALNCVILVGVGMAFHKCLRRNYPHMAPAATPNVQGTNDPPPASRAGFQDEDVDVALKVLDETFDIDRNDLDRLLRQVELQALIRSHGDLRCEDIMSRDVIRGCLGESVETARRLLLTRNIRTLPIVDQTNRLAGTVGLRELAGATGLVDKCISVPAVAAPADPAMSIIPVLTDGQTHAVVITDADGRVCGLITQTDLLAALARTFPSKDGLVAAP